MKNILLFVGLFLVVSLKSQVIVKITQSPNNTSLIGVIPSIWADAASTGWSTPDLTIAANAIEAELIFVDDATDTTIDVNGNPTWQDACEPIVNDLTGKIAVVYRSFCWHDIKANYAQQAGAIGVIIINRDPGPFAMGGSTVGSNVTIPVVSIGSEEGDLLRDYIAMGGVFAFIGTKVGLNTNDLATSKADILTPSSLTVPFQLAQNGSDFPVDFGLYAYNFGSTAQNGVTATVNVEFNGVNVFTNTSLPLNFNAPVGLILDTQYIDLGTFIPSTWNIGTYNVNYVINGADDDMSDNNYSFDFHITNNESSFAYSNVDSLFKPVANSYVSPVLSSSFSWQPCIVFRNALVGSRNIKANGMYLSAKPVGLTIGSSDFEIRAYQWNEVYTDLTAGAPTYSNLAQIGAASYYFMDESENGVNIYIPFDEAPIDLLDNQRYLFCIYSESDSLRFGYNTTVDYTTTVYDRYLQPIIPLADVPTSGASPTWYTPGFGLDYIPAMSVVFDVSNAVGISDNKELNIQLPYPNPAINMLMIPIKRHVKGIVRINMLDISGRLVLTETKSLDKDPLKINVASLKNGSYVINLNFIDGSSDSFKIAINR
jgi:hypothetical protein